MSILYPSSRLLAGVSHWKESNHFQTRRCLRTSAVVLWPEKANGLYGLDSHFCSALLERRCRCRCPWPHRIAAVGLTPRSWVCTPPCYLLGWGLAPPMLSYLALLTALIHPSVIHPSSLLNRRRTVMARLWLVRKGGARERSPASPSLRTWCAFHELFWSKSQRGKTSLLPLSQHPRWAAG